MLRIIIYDIFIHMDVWLLLVVTAEPRDEGNGWVASETCNIFHKRAAVPHTMLPVAANHSGLQKLI